jgi:hypothetical protein
VGIKKLAKMRTGKLEMRDLKCWRQPGIFPEDYEGNYPTEEETLASRLLLAL